MSVVNNNARANQVNMSPFGDNKPISEHPKTQPQQQVQDQPKPQELPKNEMPEPQKELTLDAFQNKEYVIRSLSLTKESLAFLKVMSKLEHKSQQEYLEEVIQKYKNSLPLGNDIKEKIKDQVKTI